MRVNTFSIPFSHRRKTSQDNGDKAKNVLSEISRDINININSIIYRYNVKPRIETSLSIEDNNGKKSNIQIIWKFKAFNNEGAEVQVNLLESGQVSSSTKLAARNLPQPIKDAMKERLNKDNPTGSHSTAAKEADYEVKRLLKALN
jgi:hypothetical protein